MLHAATRSESAAPCLGRASPGGVALIVNQQRQYALNLARLRDYTEQVRRVLRLGRREFNVCLLDDGEIRKLNAAYRGRRRATDVLSFPWGAPGGNGGGVASGREFAAFLGDVAISVETARRNAWREGHSTLNEIRWLILHGALHLLGYDHEKDEGEMVRLELRLRERLGIAGGRRASRARARRAHE
jgi:rRNA maturation RNase YbeY